MKKHTDTQLAAFLLEKNQNGGRVFRSYLKRNAWRLPLFFFLISFFLGLGISKHEWGFCGFLSGLTLGIIFRDGVWMKQQRVVWPFYAKVIDWIKVEKIAK